MKETKRHLVARLDNNSELSGMFEAMEQSRENAINQAEFLKKKLDQIIEAHNEEYKKQWDSVEAHCVSRGLLPSDYDKKTWELNYERDLKILIAKERQEPDGSEFLKRLFGGL